VHTISGCLAL